MIEITLNNLFSSLTTLKELSKKTLKGKTAFQIARIIREGEKEYESFEEARKKILQKYAEKNNNEEIIIDENGMGTISKENINIFNEEVKELLNSKILLCAEYIPFEDIENEDFTIEQMYALSEYIKKE